MVGCRSRLLASCLRSSVVPFGALIVATVSGCGGGWGGGSDWVHEPLVEEEAPRSNGAPRGAHATERKPTRTIGGAASRSNEAEPLATETNETASGRQATSERQDRTGGGGRILGTFRNTYYDFPNEAEFDGAQVSLMNASCQAIAQVPRSFYDAVCVQGSGSLKRGGTVSFAKRDCSCAEVCPRTGQRICFDALDPVAFPWGRGAAGRAIVPFRTVAADTTVLPMGTVVYIPELDGSPRFGDEENAANRTLDGCFVVEDRGLKVHGEHVDIFTGAPSRTAAVNARVPSNKGVTIVVDAPRCAHLARR